MTQENFNLFIGFFYIAATVIFLVMFIRITIQNRKKSDAMRKNIYTKLSNNINLESKDIVHIGKAFNLSAHQARQVIYKIFSDIDKDEDYQKLKSLVDKVEKEEPFDDLPDEVKPSMFKLADIAAATGNESDKHLITPVAHTLGKYVDLLSEQEGLKKKTNRAYMLAIASFVIGAVSSYYTVTAPSATDIVKEINKQKSELVDEKYNKKIN